MNTTILKEVSIRG